jgi:ATP-dependent DNA ligase
MQDIKPMGALGLPKGQKGIDKLESLYKDSNYVSEPKYDGSRYLLNKSLEGIFLTSRRESVNGGMCEKSANVPHIINETLDIPNKTILDGEIDIEEGRNFHYVQGAMGSLPERAIKTQYEQQKLYYKVFDILQFDGENIRQIPLIKRRELLKGIFSKYEFEYIKLVPQISSEQNKRKMFSEEIEKGNEGIILKNLSSIYTEGKKPVNSWYKVKLVNTYDGIVIGYNQGMGKYEGTVGSLIVAQYLNGILTPVADVGGMTDEMRAEFKLRIDNRQKIIIEFKAQEPEVNHRYRHPRFCRVREDKNEKECLYAQK